jgi:hypothetical protein
VLLIQCVGGENLFEVGCDANVGFAAAELRSD